MTNEINNFGPNLYFLRSTLEEINLTLGHFLVENISNITRIDTPKIITYGHFTGWYECYVYTIKQNTNNKYDNHEIKSDTKNHLHLAKKQKIIL